MVLRVAKENSAFLYALLEAYEGVVNYSTISTDKSLGYRDIYVFSTPQLEGELRTVVELIRGSIEFQVLDSQLFRTSGVEGSVEVRP